MKCNKTVTNITIILHFSFFIDIYSLIWYIINNNKRLIKNGRSEIKMNKADLISSIASKTGYSK